MSTPNHENTMLCPHCGEGEVLVDEPDSCQECCPHDDMDYQKRCPQCGKETDMGALIDAAEYRFDPER
jgi:hypothetical protein